MCARPQVFADDPGSCHSCGRQVECRVSVSTWRIALAIAEVVVRDRPAGNRRQPESD